MPSHILMTARSGKRDVRPGSILAAKYRLERQLGRGASGSVWQAENITTSRRVALKLLLDPDARTSERLLREARAAGAIKHPNVVDVFDVIVTEDGSPALVLELLEGQTLAEWLEVSGALSPREAALIGRDVASALAVAHESGIVHRDLKPANIFLHEPEDAPRVVKVVDFGISKNLFANEGTLTQAGMSVGSPPFMSPEQVQGEKDVDGRTDLWALGVILYEMLSGRRLFEGRPHEVLMQVLNRPIRPIAEVVPGLDPAFARVVASLLEREVALRESSASAVSSYLGSIASSSSRSLSPSAPPSSRRDASETSALPVSVRPGSAPGSAPLSVPGSAPGANEASSAAGRVAPSPSRGPVANPAAQSAVAQQSVLHGPGPTGTVELPVSSRPPPLETPFVAKPLETPTLAKPLETPALQGAKVIGPRGTAALAVPPPDSISIHESVDSGERDDEDEEEEDDGEATQVAPVSLRELMASQAHSDDEDGGGDEESTRVADVGELKAAILATKETAARIESGSAPAKPTVRKEPGQNETAAPRVSQPPQAIEMASYQKRPLEPLVTMPKPLSPANPSARRAVFIIVVSLLVLAGLAFLTWKKFHLL